jgi:tetratricopeptide (TPR) repeat protein
MRSLKKAVDLDPNRAEYHLYVAMAATQANPPQLGLAKTEIDRALTLDSLLADGYWQRAVIEQKEGAIEDGLRDARKALELKPTRFEAHATMAECYEQRNDPSSALAEWQKAIAADEKNPYWRYKLGRLLADRGNAAAASEHLHFATIEGGKLQPRPGWLTPAYFLSGDAYRKTGKRSEAVEAYQHFLETASSNNPDRRDAIEYLRGLGSPWQGND